MLAVLSVEPDVSYPLTLAVVFIFKKICFRRPNREIGTYKEKVTGTDTGIDMRENDRHHEYL